MLLRMRSLLCDREDCADLRSGVAFRGSWAPYFHGESHENAPWQQQPCCLTFLLSLEVAVYVFDFNVIPALIKMPCKVWEADI